MHPITMTLYSPLSSIHRDILATLRIHTQTAESHNEQSVWQTISSLFTRHIADSEIMADAVKLDLNDVEVVDLDGMMALRISLRSSASIDTVMIPWDSSEIE